MILVIDYGISNLRSIEKALTKLKADFTVSNKKEDFRSASHFILPGVGFYRNGMDNLMKLDLLDVLTHEVLLNGKYLLGICLGMQLLFSSSEEGGEVNGLNLIHGHVKRFHFPSESKLKVPHIGWNDVSGDSMASIDLFNEIEPETNFYFIHSYYVVCHEDIDCTFTDYGHLFVSAVQKGNIFGTQFHPEKSQGKGLQLLNNFIHLK